jgi:hypothetical protein
LQPALFRRTIPLVERTVVNSSTLVSIGYEPSTLTLELEFTNGSVYQYEGVPSADTAALLNAESKGSHFNAYVRDRYPHRRVQGRSK